MYESRCQSHIDENIRLEQKIMELKKELAKQKELTELWKDKYLAENEKLLMLIRE